MSATAPSLPTLVDPADLADHLGDDGLRIFDATVASQTSPSDETAPDIASGLPDFEAEHIPGAQFADLIDELSDPDSPLPFTLPSPSRFAAAMGAMGVGEGTHVVVYSQNTPMWATRLWWLLRYFGHDDASVLNGGLPAWRAAGLPLTREVPSYEPVRFRARPRLELLATRREVQRLAEEGSACLINALSQQRFEDGRIPSSVSVPAGGLLDPETGLFQPPDRLQELLASSGAHDGEPIVAYCGGGISATVDVFAFALTGRDDVQLYDGSLMDWAAGSLPLESGVSGAGGF